MTDANVKESSAYWYDVLRPPFRSTSIEMEIMWRKERREREERLQTQIKSALEEADYARLLLSIAIKQSGGVLTITNAELVGVWGHPTITSEHDATEPGTTTFKIGTR